MTDAIAGLDPVLKFIAALGAAVLVLAGFWRWVIPRYRKARSVGTAVVDTMIGREAVVDSITGREISPAVPGIGSRMADQEQHALRMAEEMGILTRAVADLASAQADMTAIQGRIDDHDRRLTAIEQGHLYERLAGKAESISAWRAVEAIAKDDVDPKP